MGWALQICNISDISMYSVVLEFLHRCYILIFVCGIQTDIYWTAFLSPKQPLLFNQCCPLQSSLHVTLIASQQFVISIFWTWAHESCSFPQIIMVSLNILSFNTILSFWKRKKSRSTKFGEQQRCGVFSQKFMCRQSTLNDTGRAQIWQQADAYSHFL